MQAAMSTSHEYKGYTNFAECIEYLVEVNENLPFADLCSAFEMRTHTKRAGLHIVQTLTCVIADSAFRILQANEDWRDDCAEIRRHILTKRNGYRRQPYQAWTVSSSPGEQA